ncbi:hypothetical protein SAZ11_53530 [Streptomyces sp. FXJ1.4098]|nr:hypothetical protein [Streptomyces sp. FXJ1.4098]
MGGLPVRPRCTARRSRPRRARGFAEDDVRVLGAALAEALERVHAAGMVHGGISADAVLVAGDGPG